MDNISKSYKVWSFISLGLMGVIAVAWLRHDSTRAIASPPAAVSKTSAHPAQIFVELAKKVVPSVVNISTLAHVRMRSKSRGGMPQTPEELFRRFFEQGTPFGEEDSEENSRRDPKSKKAVPYSLGTGFIIDSNGLILTNNHVIADADEVKVVFTQDEFEVQTDVQIVGRDPELDLALLKANTKRTLVALELGDSEALQVGEYVMAVGNPFAQGHSVSHGIVSAKDRKAPAELGLAKYLQTDAPINPGNSGGPLVNLAGEVIGINNSIIAQANNIGFAIPSNLVKSVLAQLKSSGTVSRGYIGAQISDLNPDIAAQVGVSKDLRAPFVVHVVPGEPAAKAGLEPYDIVTEVAGKSVRTSSEMIAAIAATPVGTETTLKVMRGKKTLEIKLKVAKRPSRDALMGKEDKEQSGKEKSKDKDSALNKDWGVELLNLTPEIASEIGLKGDAKGVFVESVAYESAADESGLRKGDVILEVNRKSVNSVEQVASELKGKKSAIVRIRRGDAKNEQFTIIVLKKQE